MEDPNWYDKLVPAKVLMQVDHLTNLKHENQTDIWPVIDAVVGLWKKKKPTEYRAFILDVDATRDSRNNTFGSNKKKNLRYTVDCPEWVYYVIRKLYDVDELDMNKEFWEHFWKRYPIFRVSEKL